MKHLVGDKVFIKKDLSLNIDYNGLCTVSSMLQLAGQKVTIKHVLLYPWGSNSIPYAYTIQEDPKGYFWNDGMLDDFSSEKCETCSIYNTCNKKECIK